MEQEWKNSCSRVFLSKTGNSSITSAKDFGETEKLGWGEKRGKEIHTSRREVKVETHATRPDRQGGRPKGIKFLRGGREQLALNQQSKEETHSIALNPLLLSRGQKKWKRGTERERRGGAKRCQALAAILRALVPPTMRERYI
ncbi:hypothetical protein BaRGS_00005406 [Batillaria attramentaria]|uniref:Uncharacterized protein n=1 Tax=Batillaria attramentaria TaxID=370345 RepID=A0ABD0LVG5_9CAEN